MTVFLIVAAAVAYTAGSLVVARRVYGLWRAKELDSKYERNARIYRRSRDQLLAKSIEDFAVDRPFLMGGALLLSLTWPAALPLVAVSLAAARWLDSTPVRARAELAAEKFAFKARIAELEADCDRLRAAAEHPHA